MQQSSFSLALADIPCLQARRLDYSKRFFSESSANPTVVYAIFLYRLEIQP